MIILDNINYKLEKEMFFKNISLEIKESNVIRLQGKNGSGKTTFIDLLLNLRSKEVKRNFDINDYGYLPQVAHQFPKIYIKLIDLCDKEFSFYSKELMKKSWHTSSGGERKKALIAKAISEGNKLLILDEPFNHLDEKSSLEVKKELEKLNKKGLTIIYTSHDIELEGTINIEVSKWRC
ncbi:MAG: ABC transporter ATP-binding protein [Bacteriovoracaceae bacterium]|jgi:ABC-type cobalamin/Fe3+-siderophores transport system ATPase subunit|nr:ABC transporter ATP-binding protein [Bacteriovoracaceae bacterium]